MNTFCWEDLIVSQKNYKPEGELRAYCDSFSCAKRTAKGSISNSIGVIKDVPRETWFCPDCESALNWCKINDNPKSKAKFRLSERKPNGNTQK